MDLIYKRTDELIPYHSNPRINDHAVDKVASSINNYGFKVPLIIDPQNEVIAGHTRLKAARKLGMEKVPCIIADDLTQAQKKAFRIADNRLAEEARWDTKTLRLEIEELESLGIGVEDMGFSISEIDEMLASLEEIDFEEYDGEGDGGGSQIADGDKVRVVIGSIMFDIIDPDHRIYERTKDADTEAVKDKIVSLINEGALL